MKKMSKYWIWLVWMVLLAVQPVSAFGLGDIRVNARFLTDRMAFEFKLSRNQYDDLYEINYDFLSGIDRYLPGMARGEEMAVDTYYRYLNERNDDLRWIFPSELYVRFMNLEHFYRPVYVVNRVCVLRVYKIYPDHTHFYFSRPVHYYSYCGGHSRHHCGGASYYHRHYYGHRYHHTVYHGHYYCRPDRHSHDFRPSRPHRPVPPAHSSRPHRPTRPVTPPVHRPVPLPEHHGPAVGGSSSRPATRPTRPVTPPVHRPVPLPEHHGPAVGGSSSRPATRPSRPEARPTRPATRPSRPARVERKSRRSTESQEHRRTSAYPRLVKEL